MASITLKNVPDDLLEALRDAAERDCRSMTQEIVHLLEKAVRERPRGPEAPDATAQVAAWRKLAGKWESDLDSTTEARRLSTAAR
jgi:plasmid stability protein